jgi:uncharacterized protein
MTKTLILLTALAGAVYPRSQDTHVNDFAAVISEGDAARIRTIGQNVLRERGVPIVVATIPSLAEQGAGDWSIERYATNLYNEWGIGDQARNRGVLLLVSVKDRKLRIATGTGLGNMDSAARAVIDGTVVPRFKAGDFSGGILAGVQAIGRWFEPAAAPGPVAEMPPQGIPPEKIPNGEGARWNPNGTGVIRRTEHGGGIGGLFLIILIVVGIGMLFSVFRRGQSSGGTGLGGGYSGGGGWGSFLMGGLTGFLGSQLLQSGRGRREWDGQSGGSAGGGGWFGGGGSSGGGSFGGGSSSGGGASGSW